MNMLVYKKISDGNKENMITLDKTHSNAIFERLTEKELDELKRANVDISEY